MRAVHCTHMEDTNDTPQAAAPDAAAPGATHTLTIPEVCARFAAAGVPRAERTIQSYCQLGTLDCIRVPGELGPKYLISETSVDNRIKEFVQVQQLLGSTGNGATGARTSAHERASARFSAHERASADGVADEEEALRKLQEEVVSLKSEVRARDAFINMLQTEKKDQFERLWNYTTKISEQSREIGRLEERLSIEAPRAHFPHDTTPESDTPAI